MEGGYNFVDLCNDKNTVLDGLVVTYYPNGKQKWQCNYKNGKRQGYLTLLLRDGSVVVAQYDDGELVHNYLMVTHSNGQMEKVSVKEYAHLLM
jgi:antitoxin component YwqK of YwqJK toxin-antitoxin module